MIEEEKTPFQTDAFRLFARLHERNMAETQSIQKWLMEKKDQQIAELEAENDDLRARLARIERKMGALIY